MAGQPFQTQRSITQVVRRHTPGSLMYIQEHDVYAMVTRIRGEPDVKVDRTRLHAQVQRFLERWEEREGKLRNIAADIDLDDIVAIAPSGVDYELFPHTYRCANNECQVLYDGTDRDFPGKCRRCGGELRQLPYVYYHRCGTLRYLAPPKSIFCPKHGRKELYFHDTRRFTTSSWRCRACDYQQKFWFPPCPREECRQEEHPRFQGSFWNDQWVHYGQAVNYINLDEHLADRFTRNARGRGLLHLGVLGETGAGAKRLLHTLEDEGVTCPTCGRIVPHGMAFCGHCGTRLLSGLSSSDAAQSPLIDTITNESGRCAWSILRDMEASRSLRDEAAGRTAAGKPDDDPYRWGLDTAERVGVFDVVLVNDFPLTTAAIGYTREKSGPPAWLTAFDRIDERTPIYTHSVNTEAWLVQLRAAAIARWLIANDIAPFARQLADIADDEHATKEWLIERIARADATANPADLQLRELVYGLIHSFSHVTLLSLAMRSGLDASSLGEMILPDALGFVIYAGDSDLGALTTAFDQMTPIIFASAIEDYASCKFDPTCRTDDGGACVGCIQLHRGCERFNEQLSRAYLFGGPTGTLAPGDIAHGYFAVAG